MARHWLPTVAEARGLSPSRPEQTWPRCWRDIGRAFVNESKGRAYAVCRTIAAGMVGDAGVPLKVPLFTVLPLLTIRGVSNLPGCTGAWCKSRPRIALRSAVGANRFAHHSPGSHQHAMQMICSGLPSAIRGILNSGVYTTECRNLQSTQDCRGRVQIPYLTCALPLGTLIARGRD